MSDLQHNAQKKRPPTIAKDWQLAVLRKLQSESGNPTEEQRLAVATETGLDEKWVRNWFTRQRSRLAARNRKRQPRSTEPCQPTVPTFKVQLSNPPQVASDHDPLRAFSSCRSTPTPTDPAPRILPEFRPSLASLTSHSHRPMNAQATSVTPPSNPSQNPTLVPRAATIPAYSRDPLSNRYPDFSQFFHPQVHQRFCSFQLSAEINNGDPNMHSLADPNVDSHAHGLLDSLSPFYLGGLPIHHRSSTYSSPCPVAFSMRLVDLLSHSSFTRYPIFDLGDHMHI